MAPESNKNDQLQSVSEAEKSSLHQDNKNEKIQDITTKLNEWYKNIDNWSWSWTNDILHDSKIIALKYFSGSYKNNELTQWVDWAIDINSFVTIRKDLWKTFFDNLLYKYDIPYNEIVTLANDLNVLVEEKKQELRNNHAQMMVRLSDKNHQVTESKTPEASSSNQNVEGGNVQKVNSMYELQNIDSLKNWSIVTIFDVEFTVNDSFKTYLKDSIAIVKELGLESEINALLPWGITKEETMLIAQKVMEKVKGNTAVLLKIQKSYDALDPENKNKLNEISQTMKWDNKDLNIENQNMQDVINFIDNYQWILGTVHLDLSKSTQETIFSLTDTNTKDLDIKRFEKAVSKMDTTKKTFCINRITTKLKNVEKMKFKNWENDRNIIKQKLESLLNLLQPKNKYELTTTKDVNKIKEYTDFFDNTQKNMDWLLKKELLTQDLQLPNEIQQKLSQWITNWRADKTSTKYKEELAAKWVDKVSKIFLARMMSSSPFDPENRKKYWITQDFNKMVKDIVSNQTDVKDFTVDQFYQLLTDLNTPQKKESVKDENEKTKTTESESDSKTKPEQVKTVKDFISAIKDNKENEATKSLKKPLQTFINLYESWRSPTQSEAMMMSAMPMFEQGAAAIGALGDGINQLFDGLKESGVWDEIAKIMELLFGTWSFEDRLKRFNEIKETEMTLDQSWAMNKWFEEWKKVQDKTTVTQSLDQYAITLKKDMPDKLFGNDQKWKIAMNPDWQNKEYQWFMKQFKEQTQWAWTEEPTFNNLIVWAHGTPEQRENILASPTTECPIDDIKSVVSSKVDGIYKRSNDEDRDKSNNPNESFSRAVLASLITPPKDSLRVARWVMKADKETTTSLEAQKTAEINMLKESLQLEKTANGNVKITPEQGRKVQVDWQDVPYDKTIGIQIPAWKSFSVISTSEKHKTSYWENAIKVENITLLTPTIDTKEIKTDWKIKLSWLDTKKAYSWKITYEDKSESPNQTIWEWQASELSVDKEKTPSYLILKQDDNGVKQRIAFQKKVETEAKKATEAKK